MPFFIENLPIFLKKGLTFQNRYVILKKMGQVYPGALLGRFFFFLHLIISNQKGMVGPKGPEPSHLVFLEQFSLRK